MFIIFWLEKTINMVSPHALRVLAPADNIADEVDEDEADQRQARILEQCSRMKFGKEGTWTIIAREANHAAFRKHIRYHKNRIDS
jgi:hypothetical protein